MTKEEKTSAGDIKDPSKSPLPGYPGMVLRTVSERAGFKMVDVGVWMKDDPELCLGRLQPQSSRIAAKENELRRMIAEEIRSRTTMSPKELCVHINGVTLTQVKRAMREELGGALELKTIITIGDYLGISLLVMK